ncbi:MAG: CPBP family intramembrane glutamic endopeptidase [Gemmatimonadota bacterium]
MTPDSLAANGRKDRSGPAILWMWVAAVYTLLFVASLSMGATSSFGYWLLIGLLAIVTLGVLIKSPFPPGFYGLTLRGSGASLGSAVASFAVLTGIGAAALVVGRGEGVVPSGFALLAPQLDLELLVYLGVAVPLQELVFRGIFQNGARYLLRGRDGAGAFAVAVSTTVYAASHLPWGMTAVLVAVVPGLMWGIQFERDRTLVGVTASHAALGFVVFGLTPVWSMITSST